MSSGLVGTVPENLGLKQTDHNVSAAARLLGVSRDYVRYRLENKRTGPGVGR